MSEVILVDRWEPDYRRTCCNCDTPHTVTGVRGELVVYEGDMCGVCTWGEAAMLDPDNWNK